jgi:glycosyltransferase involved in cell wall biosynthesis
MTTTPLISVVVPSFQQSVFLEDCLRSILDQDYPNKEVIVIDGGSTDGSVDIIRRFENRLSYWQSAADKGQANAVNLGWARARGEILGWVNSDDRYTTGALRAVADAYASHPAAAMWFGDVNEIDADGQRLGIKHMAGFSLRSLLLGKNMGQPGVFPSRNAFRALGGIDERLGCALDFEFFLRIWSAYPAEACVNVPAVLAESRLWEKTKSSRQAERFGREYRMVLEEFFARPNLLPDVRALKRRAFSRTVDMRVARLTLESGDWRRGCPLLMRAVWREPEWEEKPRMVWQGVRTILNARRARAHRSDGKSG